MLQANRVLAERWPLVMSAIDKAKQPAFTVSKTPDPTLVIAGKQLTSGYDRAIEAVMQASLIPPETPKIWCYGIGLGDLPSALLLRKVAKLHVVILARGVASLVLDVVPLPWLADPRVELHLARDVHLFVPFTLVPTELFFADTDALFVRDRITLENMQYFDHAVRNERNKEQSKQHDENVSRFGIDKDLTVKALFGTRPDSKAIVFMGGPTGKNYFEWVRKRLRDPRFFLVAATTSVKPLLTAGIVPHYVVCEDPLADISGHFDGVNMASLDKSVLVYIPSAHPSVLELWKGKRYRSKTGALDGDGDLLFMGGSVVHTSTDLAIGIGAREVFFIGVDLSYPGGLTHISGATYQQTIKEHWHKPAINGRGKSVYTDDNLILYKFHLERYVRAASKHVQFFKLGRDGLPLEGVQWTR